MRKAVRLPLVWTEYEKLDEDEELELRALGKAPEAYVEKGNIVVDLNSICTWFADDVSTIIDLDNGKRFKIALTEDEFTAFYCQMTLAIIAEVKTEEDDGDMDMDMDI